MAENILARNFYAEKPNEKWLTDVTEFNWYCGEEKHKLYLSAILDVVLPYLLRDGVENANIVATTSVGSLTAFPDFVTYDTAKAGAMGLVRELAAEYAPKVRVNAVAPGGVATDLLLANAEKNPEYFATMAEGFPMKRFVEMSEIADGMEYLINAKAITGITLPITCGAYMS